MPVFVYLKMLAPRESISAEGQSQTPPGSSAFPGLRWGWAAWTPWSQVPAFCCLRSSVDPWGSLVFMCFMFAGAPNSVKWEFLCFVEAKELEKLVTDV